MAAATAARGKIQTSQLALPEGACWAAYATNGYGRSLSNLGRQSLDRDMVFRDGYAPQLSAVTGTPAGGYAANLTVGLAR